MFLFHRLNEIEKKLISFWGIFLLSLKNGLIVAYGEFDLILKWSDLLLYFDDITTKRLWVIISVIILSLWIAWTIVVVTDLVVHWDWLSCLLMRWS